ncbi:16632_t:CDS:2, partial [Funneliformis geosporum]
MASLDQINNRSETFNDHQRRLNQIRQRNYKRRRINNNIDIRHDLGSMNQLCLHCVAKFWMDEKNQRSTQISPIFSVCCVNGKVRLLSLLKPPPYLMNLYISSESEANSFRKMLEVITHSWSSLSSYWIIITKEEQVLRFAQLYIYNTEHEIRNHLNLMQNLNATILKNLQNMLDIINPYIHIFRQAQDIFQTSETSNISMLIHNNHIQNLHSYSIPTSSEVAALMIGDRHDIESLNRDILLRTREGGLQRISELNSSYDTLHYVLLFPKGDD